MHGTKIDLLAKATNPLDGVNPNIDVLGAKFQHIWQVVAAGVWGVLLAVAVIYLLKGFANLAAAKKQTYSQGVTDAAGEVKHASMGIVGLLMAGVIVGAFIKVTS